MSAKPAPVESLSVEEASAEIATHRAGPVSALRSRVGIPA